MSDTAPSRRILFVDDEPNVLEGLERRLRKKFDVVTAVKGPAGLVAVRSKGPFAAVVSDLRMPGMDGIAFLSRIRQVAPDTVRLLLSGNADFEAAVDVVNKGNIFRILVKPCPTDVLTAALEAAVEQYRLVTAERVLLEQTLHGSINMLSDVLALSNPSAFGRGMQAKQLVAAVIDSLDEEITRWPIELAAMLSQIGCITLSPETVEKLYHGEALAHEEQEAVDQMPQVAGQLIASIPRLEPVSEILHYLGKNFDGSGTPDDRLAGLDIPWGTRLLRVILDFEARLAAKVPPAKALEELTTQESVYDPDMVQLFTEVYEATIAKQKTREVSVSELQPRMVFAEEVCTANGTRIVARGQEVTMSLLKRLANFRRNAGIQEPLRVYDPD